MKISGTVYGTDGTPLPNANVVKFGNSQINTEANKNGYFEIDSSNISAFDNFKISYVGYETKMVKASELQNAKITLKEDIETLAEVLIKPEPKQTPLTQAIATTKKYKTPLIVVGSLGLITAGFLLIKKMTI